MEDRGLCAAGYLRLAQLRDGALAARLSYAHVHWRPGAARRAAAATSQPQAYFAKRFAAKEAVYKALSGAGVSGLGWQQAETLSLPNGAPVMSLSGQCKTALEALTPDGYKAQISISLSDEPPYALAFVIINAVPLKLDS